jgi:2-polyprenyl-3-methyl-5-hydroxy-6-metoxy-1,4-benzoquinol methylase
MPDDSTDTDWEFFGKTDPYWAVYTDERFRKNRLTDDALEQFFASGKAYVQFVLERIRAHLDRSFTPRKVLDFGCGVGRLLIPFAARSETAVGMDVSESMLQEARRRCADYGLTNVQLVRSDDDLSNLTGSFDLINSYIVLQHIPPARGEVIAGNLLRRLEDGGIGVLHFTYDKPPVVNEQAERSPRARSYASTAGDALRRRFRGLLRWLAPPPRRPREMQMNAYNLNSVLAGLQSAGIRRMHVEFTNHDGCYGVLLFFKNQSDDRYEV